VEHEGAPPVAVANGWQEVRYSTADVRPAWEASMSTSVTDDTEEHVGQPKWPSPLVPRILKTTVTPQSKKMSC
jgi:hypothetical protein